MAARTPTETLRLDLLRIAAGRVQDAQDIVTTAERMQEFVSRSSAPPASLDLVGELAAALTDCVKLLEADSYSISDGALTIRRAHDAIAEANVALGRTEARP